MNIPPEEIEYIRFILISDGIILLFGVVVIVLYVAAVVVEWIRRMRHGH